jgi:hypothetical protein
MPSISCRSVQPKDHFKETLVKLGRDITRVTPCREVVKQTAPTTLERRPYETSGNRQDYTRAYKRATILAMARKSLLATAILSLSNVGLAELKNCGSAQFEPAQVCRVAPADGIEAPKD